MNNFEQFLQTIEEQLVSCQEKDDEIRQQAEAEGKTSYGNNVIEYVRKFFVLKAVHNTAACFQNTTTYVSNRSFDVMRYKIQYLKRYDWFENITVFPEGDHWKLNYSINEEAISNGFRRMMNETFNLQLPELEKQTKDVDNSLLKAINCPEELNHVEAGLR